MSPGKGAGVTRRSALVAIGLPIAIFVVQWFLWRHIAPYAWVLFFPAVFLSAWMGGLTGGLLATALSTLLVWYGFLPPEMEFNPPDGAGALSAALFASIGIGISAMQQRLHRANARAAEANEDLRTAYRGLEERIFDRAKELARTNESLRLSESRLHAIVENLVEGVCVSDLNGKVIQFNRAAVEMHGFASEREWRLQLEEFATTFEVSTLQGVLCTPEQWPLGRILRGEHLRDVELRIRRLDAEWTRVFSFGGDIVPDADGKPLIAVLTFTDVTQRKHAEEALFAAKVAAELSAREKSEALGRLNEAQHTARIGSWDMNMNDHTVRWSDEMYRIFELDPRTFVPGVEANARYVHPDDMVPYHLAMEHAVRTQGELDCDLRILTGTGALKYCNSKGRLQTDHAGRPERFFGTLHDITDRKRAELELRKFASLAENSLEFIGMSDLQGKPFFINQAARRLVGIDSLEQAARTPVADFFFPEDRAFVMDQFLPRVQRDTHGEVEIRFRHFKTGEPIWMIYNVFTLRDEHDQPIAYATVSRDISARKAAEQALHLANEELERKVAARTEELRIAKERAETADSLKSEFLAHMSHELRTPLNAIIGFAGTLLLRLPGPLNADQSRQLETIQTSARHLLALINDLLDVSKIEAGKVEAFLETVDCRQVVEDISATMDVEARRKGLTLETQLPDAPLPMRTDRRMIRQILLNLLSNAIKFTERGHVRVTLHGTGTAEDEVRICVEDTGVGIRPEDSHRIFARFDQIRASREATSEGTGLGLYLSQRLAVMLGGQIVFQSEFGKGSRFTLTLHGA